jgi:branched-chain amino acid transport system substrate-binding protein
MKMLGGRRAVRQRTRAAIVACAVLALLIAACGGEPLVDIDGDEENGDAQPDETDPDETDPDAAGPEPDPDVDAPEGDPLRIGIVGALSGAIAIFGVAAENAAQMAIDELNDSGGVLGQPLELISRDSQARPEEGVAQARDLILTEEIDMLLGPISSGVALAITEIAHEHEVPFIVHTSNTEALMNEAYHEFFASVVPNTGMEARAQGIDLAQSEYTRWATIAPDYEFGQRQTGTFVETVTELNDAIEIVEQQWPELGESDFDPFVSSLLGSGAEAIYSPLFATDLVTFTRQAADLGFFDEGPYFTALYETDALQELGDEVDLEGVRAYSRCPFTIDTPQMTDFVERYTERYGNVPSDWACMAYDAVMLWAQVVESAGDASGQAFADAVGGFEFTSLRGETYIRDVDHQAAIGSYISELTWSDEHDMYIYETAEPVPAEEIWRSEDEVVATRG